MYWHLPAVTCAMQVRALQAAERQAAAVALGGLVAAVPSLGIHFLSKCRR
jgi:hypothetical protein